MTTFVTLVLVGIACGCVNGAVAAGGGPVLTVALVVLLGLPQAQAQGTTLMVFAVGITAPAAYVYWRSGAVSRTDLLPAVVLAAGFVLGSVVMASVAVHLPSSLLRKLFALVLALLAAYLFWNPLGKVPDKDTHVVPPGIPEGTL